MPAQIAQTSMHDLGGGDRQPVVWDPTSGNLFNQQGTQVATGGSTGYVTTVPASSTSAGVRGQWTADAFYHYDCIATNTWRRTSNEAF